MTFAQLRRDLRQLHEGQIELPGQHSSQVIAVRCRSKSCQGNCLATFDLRGLRERHPEADVHVYPAGHGFNCDQRADYNEEVSKQALERTLSFFQKTLR